MSTPPATTPPTPVALDPTQLATLATAVASALATQLATLLVTRDPAQVPVGSPIGSSGTDVTPPSGTVITVAPTFPAPTPAPTTTGATS